MLVLVIGDFYLGQRASGLPAAFKELLVPGRIQRILCVGGLGHPSVVEDLKRICPEMTHVSGPWDQWQGNAPVTSGGGPLQDLACFYLSPTATSPSAPVEADTFFESAYRVTMTNGHGGVLPNASLAELERLAVHTQADIVISGSGGATTGSSATDGEDVDQHALLVAEKDGRIYLRPGSATGSGRSGLPASFILLDVQPSMISIYTYKCDLAPGANVKVDKVDVYLKVESEEGPSSDADDTVTSRVQAWLRSASQPKRFTTVAPETA